MKLFLKLIAVGEEAVSLLPFTRKLFIHRRYREKVKEEVERLKINIQWQILFEMHILTVSDMEWKMAIYLTRKSCSGATPANKAIRHH